MRSICILEYRFKTYTKLTDFIAAMFRSGAYRGYGIQMANIGIILFRINIGNGETNRTIMNKNKSVRKKMNADVSSSRIVSIL